MKSLSRLALPAWLLLMAVLTSPCFGGQSLPDGWWLQDSPEKVLANAQATNQSLAFFHAEKIGSKSSAVTSPFAETNDTDRLEFFQRRDADALVETKKFIQDGKFQWTDYKLKSGDYVLTYGQLIKTEYEQQEGIEKSLAAKFDHPYEFKILKSELVGTNDCIVIARIMTEPFLEAVWDVRKSPEKQYIQSETDYYFRKSDGVTFGLTKVTRLGEEMIDEVYNNVEINQPIPDQEFLLPKGGIKIAKNSVEFQNILMPSVADAEVEKRVTELPWASDVSAALQQAKAENKMVLLDFTGSDWCVWCIKFDNDVLSKPEFASYAKTNLVMVMLDFPKAKPQSESVKQANKDLQAKFKVKSFPTYVALTPDGKEIGRQVGYLQGGPQAFIAELDKFRKP